MCACTCKYIVYIYVHKFICVMFIDFTISPGLLYNIDISYFPLISA